ncbi:PhoU domain-containing protein, partial [Gemmatimonadota bacterium]
MWKQIFHLFKKESLTDEAFKEAIIMLKASQIMFTDAVASLREKGSLEYDIYERDRQINKYERDVRRKIVTHLAISQNPDANHALVLTAIVIDIERIGDFTKNIVELAQDIPDVFDPGEIDDDVSMIEDTLASMFETII